MQTLNAECLHSASSSLYSDVLHHASDVPARNTHTSDVLSWSGVYWQNLEIFTSSPVSQYATLFKSLALTANLLAEKRNNFTENKKCAK